MPICFYEWCVLLSANPFIPVLNLSVWYNNTFKAHILWMNTPYRYQVWWSFSAITWFSCNIFKTLYVFVLTGVCTTPWVMALSSMFQYWLEYVPRPGLRNYHLCFSIDWSMYHALGYGTIIYVSVLTGVCTMPWVMALSSTFRLSWLLTW